MHERDWDEENARRARLYPAYEKRRANFVALLGDHMEPPRASRGRHWAINLGFSVVLILAQALLFFVVLFRGG